MVGQNGNISIKTVKVCTGVALRRIVRDVTMDRVD